VKKGEAFVIPPEGSKGFAFSSVCPVRAAFVKGSLHAVILSAAKNPHPFKERKAAPFEFY
jgi:hypothetical protein